MDTLRAAASYLAGLDADYAQQSNGVGYSKADGSFGHALADTPPEAWTPEVTRAAWLMLRRYKVQLAAIIDFDTIPEPPDVGENRDVRAIDHDGTRFTLRFGYDPMLVDAVKRLPGRRWDPTTKRWTAPGSDALTAFAAEHQFAWTAAATAALATPADEQPPATAGSVTQDGPRLVIRTEYDPALVAAIREIPGRRWDATTKSWLAPISSIAAVHALAERYSLTWNVPDDIDETALAAADVAVSVSRETFVVEFGYDRDLVNAIRDIPGAVWNRTRFAWTVPTSASVDLLEMLHGRSFSTDATADTLLGEARAALERVAASAATDADIAIPGLGGDLMPFQRAGVRYALQALGYQETATGWTRTPN